jgi:hypothetical protein
LAHWANLVQLGALVAFVLVGQNLKIEVFRIKVIIGGS